MDSAGPAGTSTIDTALLAQAPGAGVKHSVVAENPWLCDEVLLSLAMWWVKMTRPNSHDFATEVALEFDSLQRDLRTAL